MRAETFVDLNSSGNLESFETFVEHVGNSIIDIGR